MELFPYVDLRNRLLAKLDKSKVGQPGGAASLGDDGKLPSTQVPQTILDAASGAEQKQNKGQPGGYASLNGSGQVPVSQLPPSTVPAFASLNTAMAGERDDRIISPWSMKHVLDNRLGGAVEDLEGQIAAVYARIPAWEPGIYRPDSVVQYNGAVWRSTEDTEDIPGPLTENLPPSDTSLWLSQAGSSNPPSTITDFPDGVATLATGTVWSYGHMSLKAARPASEINGLILEFELNISGGDSNSRAKFGIGNWEASPSAPTGPTINGVANLSAANIRTGGAWVWWRMEFTVVAGVVTCVTYKNGVQVDTVTGSLSSFSQGWTPRISVYGNGDNVFHIRNVRVIGATSTPGWEHYHDVGSTKFFNRLAGVPTQFPPTSHTHSADQITSGEISRARLPGAVESATGLIELATPAEAAAGTDHQRAITPKTLRQEMLKPLQRILDWSPSIAYKAGDLVDHDGYCWKATADLAAGEEPMAPPSPTAVTIVDTVVTSITTSSSTLTVNLPSGIQSDDVLVIGVISTNGAGSAVPAGYDQQATVSSTNRSGRILTRQCDGSEGASVDISVSTAADGQTKAVAVLLRGVQEIGTAEAVQAGTSVTTYTAMLHGLDSAYDKGIVISGLTSGQGGRTATLSEGTELEADNSGGSTTLTAWEVDGPRAAANITATASGGGRGVLLTIPLRGQRFGGAAWKRRYQLID